MELRSLGYQTDLIFPAFEGEILDRGSYLVIRTPSNPTFYWGNFLLFASPPGEGDFERWRDIFSFEIGSFPEVRHQTFGWDTTDDEIGAAALFIEAGFHLDRSVVLTGKGPLPPARSATGVDFRPLRTDSDWEQAVENQVVCREPVFAEAGYREFRKRDMQRYRSMASANLGTWFGAFYDGRLIADLGVFHHREIGRYQSVQTHPDYRRRGIAGTLVYEAGRYAIRQFGLEKLVIVAEADSTPSRLYQSLGFRQTEYQLGLSWWQEQEDK
jgi:GNAT superfamily N-acetyltransferase